MKITNQVDTQIQVLNESAKKAWFFNSIFGLLGKFGLAVKNVPYQTAENEPKKKTFRLKKIKQST
ncbi:MAG: hypothetical protein WC785_05915 [Tatlockia sp.]|jgi:hypothetical protein